ncbi:uncharacterized protein N7473_001423 [Penicillium subrubescens]|jgi:hypothetical protein|uniref:INO80 complex subunit F domain-containing protein n=1 Tax=Penicillium subrubescens TaxID=1316194 RepID=A0A1Q5T8N3_9EURO|nr:uncharacterized protein N7473_001423 [Penicillium subrubescens]KAJ5912120.1 hypothetical protein N7473_001423 [Penicillium subrubescens]OKO96587.1 hypothetical protein PENSUB_10762 [Penicillium subrubescens]
METRPTTTANPPSVEIAYKRKCAALKKRLAEVEAENELMRTRNLRGYQYIQKMRLESCMLLERLAKVTGMADEAAAGTADPELRARAAAMMSNSAVLNGLGGSGAASGGNGAYLEDETEGSSDEQPPTPEERPLRVKRSRKSNLPTEGGDEDTPAQEAGEGGDGEASLPRLAPAPSQQELTSSFRVKTDSNGVQDAETPADGDNRDAQSDEQAGETGADDGATPMDVDSKEPKVEQG